MPIWIMLHPSSSPKNVRHDPNVESGGLNLMNLKGKINNLQIVTSDKQEVRDRCEKNSAALSANHMKN